MIYFIFPNSSRIGHSIESGLYLQLNKNKSYMMMIADRQFYFINPLPSYFPRSFINLPQNSGAKIISLSVTKHIKYRLLLSTNG